MSGPRKQILMYLMVCGLDVENLRQFVQDYTVRALIPFVEKLVNQLNDAVNFSNKIIFSEKGTIKQRFESQNVYSTILVCIFAVGQPSHEYMEIILN